MMFNLIMKGLEWPQEGRTTFPGDRVFEYTGARLDADHRDDNGPLFDKLRAYPCLFMQEGIRDERAHVGWITRVRAVGRDLALEYTFDQEVPPIQNSVIYANRHDFDMPEDFEFSRNHWAIKDVDLYRTLLRHVRPRRQRPVVFDLPEHERIEPALASAMMPFTAQFTSVYEAIQGSCELSGLRCRRADDIWENPAIIQDIVSLIDRSRVVICDCTGRNPNVFYEIGIAHTLGREVILITQNEADIPFDLRHLRYISYLNNQEGRERLREALTARLQWLVGQG